MRRHERHEQRPRAVAPLRRLLVQPHLRARGDVSVVHRVRRLTGSRTLRHLVPAPALGNVLADEALHVADAVDDVHRDDLLREAVVVAGSAPEVQLANRHDPVTRLAQPVMPARQRAVVAVGVVPVADLVVVASDGECRARRHADRAGGIGRREARPGGRQRIQVGRRDERVSGGAEELGVVLVGHEDEQICRSHRAMPLLTRLMICYSIAE